MTSQESRRHHFVPEFLLKPWAVDGLLNGFWWDHREGRLSCRRKGAKAFCYGIDLLSVKRHEDDRDVLERKFFGAIDTKGAVARDRLLVEGSASVVVDQRCDFARLLLSLEARRPVIVHRLREEGSRFLSDSLDSDPEILDAMEREGFVRVAFPVVRATWRPSRRQGVGEHPVPCRSSEHWTNADQSPLECGSDKSSRGFGGAVRSTARARSWPRSSRCGLVPAAQPADHILCRKSEVLPP